MGLKSGEVQKLFEGIENKSEGIEGKKQENINRAKEFAENNQIPESPEEFKKFQDSLRPISDANGTLAAKTREIKFNLRENNTTEITNFKKQFEKEVLSNPDFADGDIPEELQRKIEKKQKLSKIINSIESLMKTNKKDFLEKIHNLTHEELKQLLVLNRIANSKNPSRKNNRIIQDRMEDITNLYSKIGGIEEEYSAITDNDNIPTDNKGNRILPDEI